MHKPEDKILHGNNRWRHYSSVTQNDCHLDQINKQKEILKWTDIHRIQIYKHGFLLLLIIFSWWMSKYNMQKSPCLILERNLRMTIETSFVVMFSRKLSLIHFLCVLLLFICMGFLVSKQDWSQMQLSWLVVWIFAHSNSIFHWNVEFNEWKTRCSRYISLGENGICDRAPVRFKKR